MKFRGLWEELRAPANLESDFGRLTAAEQVAALIATKPPGTPIDWGIDQVVGDIQDNAKIVRDQYSLNRIGERLRSIYAAIETQPTDPQPPINGSHIIEHFSNPELQLPICTEVVSDSHLAKLSETIALLSYPLDPQPTHEKPVIKPLESISAVVFDIYGTLLISGSGDISLASEGSRDSAALEALVAVTGEPEGSSSTIASGSPTIVEEFLTAIRAAHADSSSEYPEVEIREIWKTVLEGFGLSLTTEQIERLAIEYECRVNPIWPMPGLAETLAGLKNLGKSLGIVSNAQFFSPLAFQPLTGKSLEAWGFEQQLSIWSFEHREAKPGTFLYERCAEALAEQGIEPSEALFVGNDLRNDVWPAQQVGFKTALFAGDARSLRWRSDDERLSEVRPEAVVTDLRQLLEIAL